MNENYQNQPKESKIKLILIILLVLVIIVVAFILFFKKEEQEEEPKDQTIFERAYSNLNFKESPTLTKVYCSTNVSNGSEVSDEKILIYYFDKNELTTYISHDDIKLTDTYMDYYDEMYDKYLESLKNDDKYKNVKKSVEKGDKEMLITIITTKSNGESSISLPSFVNPAEAKQKAIAEGYTCK